MKNLNKRKTQVVAKQKYWEKEKPLLMIEQDLKKDKKETKDRYKAQKQSLTTTKFLMLFLFTSCSIIQVFTLVVTIMSMIAGVYDFTALQMLITAVVGEVVAFAIYSIKSLKQNTKGGIIYETAMWKNEKQFNQEVKG